jgi:hypothetical protein
MKKNLDTPVLDLDGMQMIERVRDQNRVATVRHYIINALAFGNGQPLTGEEKIGRYKLAMRLHECTEYDFVSEELSLIKRAVEPVYPALIVGRVFDWADE